jgi:NTE family protein
MRDFSGSEQGPQGVSPPPRKTGLILTGGGARAAYQAGAVQAIAAMLPAGAPNPFPVICGTSAGAVNAAALAAGSHDFAAGAARLVATWSALRVDDVYHADGIDVARSLARWFGGFLIGDRGRRGAPISLLDNAPLRQLLERSIDFARIQPAIDDGVLDALCVTASGYTSGYSLSFFQAAPHLTSWRRARRTGVAAQVGASEVMASTAIPFVFPPVKLAHEYCGDGSIQQLAPFSPALHLGAERVLAISVGRQGSHALPELDPLDVPSLAHIGGRLLDCVFSDTLEMDLERLERINHTIGLMPEGLRDKNGVTLRSIDTLLLAPSRDIESIALSHVDLLPRAVRFLLRCLGASGASGASLLSYLLFEATFCRQVIELGYTDTMARRDEILAFLGYSAEGLTQAVVAGIEAATVDVRTVERSAQV